MRIDVGVVDAIALLRDLISTPSFSRQEDATAALLEHWLQKQALEVRRSRNNVWCLPRHYEEGKPTVLLCSHHDTVRPVATWKRDPFEAVREAGRIYGLGSNDAGGAVAAMCAVFASLQASSGLPFNLVLAITAEEEVAGEAGIASICDSLPRVSLAIVGEPTGMELAVAEKGLMVLDGSARGEAGHAARDTGVNAISVAMRDVQWFESYRFEKESTTLGPVRMSVTQIQSGTQHNVIPDRCDYVVDIRMTDAYTHEEILEIVRSHVSAEVRPRSMRLRPSAIAPDHAIVRAARDLGIACFASPSVPVAPSARTRRTSILRNRNCRTACRSTAHFLNGMRS